MLIAGNKFCDGTIVGKGTTQFRLKEDQTVEQVYGYPANSLRNALWKREAAKNPSEIHFLQVCYKNSDPVQYKYKNMTNKIQTQWRTTGYRLKLGKNAKTIILMDFSRFSLNFTLL